MNGPRLNRSQITISSFLTPFPNCIPAAKRNLIECFKKQLKNNRWLRQDVSHPLFTPIVKPISGIT